VLSGKFIHTHTHTHTHTKHTHTLIFCQSGLVSSADLWWAWSCKRESFMKLKQVLFLCAGWSLCHSAKCQSTEKNSKDRPAGPILFWPTNWFLGAGIWNCLQSDTSTYVIHIRSVICCIKTKVHTIRFYITVLITGLAQKTTELDFTYWCLNISVTVLKVSTDSRSVESH